MWNTNVTALPRGETEVKLLSFTSKRPFKTTFLLHLGIRQMPARAGLLFYQLLFTEDAKTVVQSTKFKVTPNKTVCFYIHLESILAAKHT